MEPEDEVVADPDHIVDATITMWREMNPTQRARIFDEVFATEVEVRMHTLYQQRVDQLVAAVTELQGAVNILTNVHNVQNELNSVQSRLADAQQTFAPHIVTHLTT